MRLTSEAMRQRDGAAKAIWDFAREHTCWADVQGVDMARMRVTASMRYRDDGDLDLFFVLDAPARFIGPGGKIRIWTAAVGGDLLMSTTRRDEIQGDEAIQIPLATVNGDPL